MASKPVEIKVTGKTQEFTKAVDKGVVDPLQEAQEALKDVQKQSDKTSESLVDDMKAAQKATEKLEDENRTLADTIAKGSKKAYKQMGDAAEAGTHKAVDATADFKDEAR